MVQQAQKERPRQASVPGEAKGSVNSRTNFTTPAPDREEIVKALGVLFEPGDVGELRVLRSKPKQTDSGYFEVANSDYIADFAARYNNAGQVYVVMNRIKPDLLARAANRITERADKTTQDADIIRRRWFLIDLDPKRSAGISASDAELEAAKRKADAVREFLAAAGWPAPTVAESGNGVHLLYPIDLPNDNASKDLIQEALKGLAAQFDDEAVGVDQTVFNAARITKLYGTVAKKGDHIPARPWRLSRILEAPGRSVVVTLEQLAEMHIGEESKQSTASNTRARQASTQQNGAPFDLDVFLARLGIGYDQDTHDGSARYKLAHCPFNPEHGKGEAAIFRHPSGGLGFKCQHNSCADKKWRHVRELVDGPKESRARPHAADARETNQRARVEAADVEALSALIESLGDEKARTKARQILEALHYVRRGDALGASSEKRQPMIAGRVIGLGLNNEYAGNPDTGALGRALCAWWDSRERGGATGIYDKANPNYAREKGAPITLVSIFKLATERGYRGERGEKGEKRRHTGDSAGRIAGESGRIAGDFTPEEAKKRAREALRPAELAPPPYPVNALGEVLGPAVEATSEAGQMSIAMAGQAFLAAAALLAQGRRNVMSPSGIKPLSLYLLTLAESGDGKSTAEGAALHPIRAWQRRKVEEYRRDLAKFQEAESSRKGGDQVPLKPLEPYAILKDFTVEGVRAGFQEGRPSQACFTSEGAAILAGHGMTQENRQKTAANLNALWDDGELSVSRALAGRIQLYGKRFSAHLLIQPDAAREALGDAMLSTMGFWPRFLIAWPEPAKARQFKRFEADKLPEVARAWGRFTELLRDPVPDDCGSLPVIEFDDVAEQRILKPAFEEFERQARNDGGDYGHIKPFALRATEQLCRVAGVLAVIDGAERIGVDAAARALALVHYSIDTWRSMAGEREEDERRVWALTLFDWMAEHDGFSSESAMLRIGPKKHSLRSRSRRDAALATLEMAGLVEREGNEWSITP